MSKKIQVSLDAQKLRELVSKRNYTNHQGEYVEVQEVKFDLIEMKHESHKVIYSHEKFDLIKTHFAVQQQTKEEREANTPPNYIGEGISQVWKSESSPTVTPAVEEDDSNSLPF